MGGKSIDRDEGKLGEGVGSGNYSLRGNALTRPPGTLSRRERGLANQNLFGGYRMPALVRWGP